MPGVERQVGGGGAGPDHRREVDDDVDALQEVTPRPGLPDVEDVDARGRVGARLEPVRLGEQQVDGDDVVPVGDELAPGRGADEPGRAGQEDAHGRHPAPDSGARAPGG